MKADKKVVSSDQPTAIQMVLSKVGTLVMQMGGKLVAMMDD